jgi:hypothetical protein
MVSNDSINCRQNVLNVIFIDNKNVLKTLSLLTVHYYYRRVKLNEGKNVKWHDICPNCLVEVFAALSGGKSEGYRGHG